MIYMYLLLQRITKTECKKLLRHIFGKRVPVAYGNDWVTMEHGRCYGDRRIDIRLVHFHDQRPLDTFDVRTTMSIRVST